MALATSKPKLRMRLVAVIATCVLILATLGFLAYLVSGAFGSMASAADQIDNARAVSAANGALRALQKQLGATVRDNAYWDDAYRNVSAASGADWAVENWGTITEDYPLYDTAMVMEPDGSPLIAYHAGAVLRDPGDFYLGALGDVLAAARRTDPAQENLPVAFIRTREGFAIIGAAAIQPSEPDQTFDLARSKILVFSKQLTPKVISEISTTFSIGGLALTEAMGPERLLHVDLKDIRATPIAYFTWPPVEPGTASYLRVRPTVVGSAFILALLLGTVAASGLAAFRAVRNGERASNYKAKHDPLTGLWNRAGCLEQLEIALSSTSGGRTCLNILDLDGFKPVNDAWGHAVGDELIKAVAERLLACLPPSAVISRLGGDEFAVVYGIPAVNGSSDRAADRILVALSAPFIIGGRTIEIGGSVGTAEAENGSLSSTELLRRADLALYRAKDLGRGVSFDYQPSLDEDAVRSADLEQELRQALNTGAVRVAFQPLIDASSREVSGVEALARWTSPTRGNLAPEVFIRVAEKAGLIDQLGFEVLRTAVREGARWPGIGISVNISPIQLKNPYFAMQVGAILSDADFDPGRLTIEVTEGVLISNPDQAKRAFKALRELGLKIALDDFGCGYASIGTLREFGFDGMKIDRSLIVALDHDDRGGAVLQATIALANALHLPVTAEGIETEEQAAVVRLSGCDKLQGYLFSEPVSAEEITKRYFPPASSSLARAG